MLVAIAAKALVERISEKGIGYGISGCDFEKNLSWINENANNSCDNAVIVTNFAITQAVHELLWSSAMAEAGEEHQTASLMGHISGNYGWYSLAAEISRFLSDSPNHSPGFPEILWATQSHDEEKESGADFIVAVRENQSSYRVALFQAKLCDGENIELWRPPSSCKDQKGTRDCDKNLYITRDIFCNSKTPLLDYYKNLMVNEEIGKPSKIHQIQKVINMQVSAHSIKSEKIALADWCHYLLLSKPPTNKKKAKNWKPSVPLTVPASNLVSELFLNIRDKNDRLHESDFKIKIAEEKFASIRKSFIDEIMSIVEGSDEGRSLLLDSLDKLKGFFYNLARFAPISHVMVVDEEGGGGPIAKILNEHGYTVGKTIISRSEINEIRNNLTQNPSIGSAASTLRT